MKEDTQEVRLTVGKPIIPADQLIINDKVYGERHFLREGAGYKEYTKDPIVPIRIHVDRKYVMHDSASFIEAVKMYGESEKGVIFYELTATQNNTAGTVTMFFEHGNRKESVTLPLLRSLEFRAFLNGKEKAFSQKEFLKLLETFPECVGYAPLLRPMVEKVQLSTKIEFEANLDPNNITFIYQEKSGGNQTGTLPRKITLSLPYFEGSTNKVTIEADLEVTMPKQENAKPEFRLVNIKHERTEREALTAEIATLHVALTGWLFVNGKYS